MGLPTFSARYQEYYEDTINYLVLVFLRYGENNPDYQKLKQDIDDYFGFPASQRLVFYASPCTMLIIANHFAEEDEEPIRLGKVSKSDNGDLLLQHGVKIPDPPYGAKQEQRKALMDAVTKANYRVMKNKVAAFKGPDIDCPATNALDLFEGIEYGHEGTFVEELVDWIETQRKHWDE